jgi:hypothetical protein
VRECPKEVLPVLLTAMKDENSDVRCAAVNALRQVAREYPKEVLPTLLDAIKADREERVREGAVSVLRQRMSIPCSLSFFQDLLHQAQQPQQSRYAAQLLPLLCHYYVHWQFTGLTSVISNNLVPLSELAHAIAELADTQQRTAVSTRLRAYYRHHGGGFIEQLIQCLLEQHNSSSEIACVCQLLGLSSSTWLYSLQSWLRNNHASDEWEFPLACLAELLCYEGASLVISHNVWRVCQGAEMTSIELPLDSRWVFLVLKQIRETLKTRQVPCRQTETLSRRDLPLLLPRSKQRFFSDHEQTSRSYQPVITYQKAHVTRSSVDCQDFCRALFQAVQLIPLHPDAAYGLLHDPQTQAYKIKLPKNRSLSDSSFSQAMKALFRADNAPLQALDLSENQLTDRDVVVLCQYLKRHDLCSILRLSHNQLTVDGLSTLMMTLREKPSIKYLLLDHNWISFDPAYFCDLVQREQELRLVNLDLSLNYIPKGALYNGKDLIDDETLQRQFKEEVNVCQRSIAHSLILHSCCTDNQHSFLREHCSDEECDEFFNQINTAKGCVGLLSYLDPVLTVFGTHSFLVIERIHPEYGQRQLIFADLVIDDQKNIMIRVSQTNPKEFLEHIGGFKKVGGRLALAPAEKIIHLLNKVYESRDVKSFSEYQALPRNRGKVNCHTQAVRWLIDAKIIPADRRGEWIHVEPKTKCVIA